MEKELRIFRAGVDVGSTTVKLAVLNAEGETVFGEYRRHHAQTQETLGSCSPWRRSGWVPALCG
jgi:activator of 2-hydroxyglutaryl-CoA dehydratase